MSTLWSGLNHALPAWFLWLGVLLLFLALLGWYKSKILAWLSLGVLFTGLACALAFLGVNVNTQLASTPGVEAAAGANHVAVVRVVEPPGQGRTFTGLTFPPNSGQSQKSSQTGLHYFSARPTDVFTYTLPEGQATTGLLENALLRVDYTCTTINCSWNDQRTVKAFGVLSTSVDAWTRLGIILSTGVALYFLCLALLNARSWQGFTRLLIGKDNRYSNAQFQMTMWFFVLLIGLVSTIIVRFIAGGSALAMGVGASGDLIALSGFAVFTWIGASAITKSQVENGQKSFTKGTPEWSQLYSNDADIFDYGDFQSLMVTVVAVVGYLIALSGFHDAMPLSSTINLPDVGGTVLTIFGAGQATYLLKKALNLDTNTTLILVPQEITVQKGQKGLFHVLAQHARNSAPSLTVEPSDTARQQKLLFTPQTSTSNPAEVGVTRFDIEVEVPIAAATGNYTFDILSNAHGPNAKVENIKVTVI